MRTSRLSRLVAAAAASLVLVGALSGCSLVEEFLEYELDAPSSSSPSSGQPAEQPATDQPLVAPTDTAFTADYYSVVGIAVLDYRPSADGVVEYCPLDQLGRAVCAYGNLTSSQRQAASDAGRQDVNVDPSGWPQGADANTEVTIPALPGVEGSRDYKGWFWNRSHLVADSLGGDAIAENLVTGTRTQNVGSTQVGGQFSGGMAYTELLARDYLDRNDGDACPLYYAATANYDGEQLIPSTVTVDVYSCDETINERVVVSNTANGFAIDYVTGAFAPIQH